MVLWYYGTVAQEDSWVAFKNLHCLVHMNSGALALRFSLFASDGHCFKWVLVYFKVDSSSSWFFVV